MIVNPTNKSVTKLEGLHLFHSDMSNCSMRVRMALVEKDLPWTSHHLDLRKKEAVTPEYFGIHPKGLVPTLVHDGVVHIEFERDHRISGRTFSRSAAATQIAGTAEGNARLAAHRDRNSCPGGEDADLHPKNRQSAAQERRGGCEVSLACSAIPNCLPFTAPPRAAAACRQEKVDAAERRLLDLFGKAESELEQHEWLVGDQFSLADIAWVPLHFTLVGVDFPFERFPRVSAWAEAIRERPSFQEGVLRWCAKF